MVVWKKSRCQCPLSGWSRRKMSSNSGCTNIEGEVFAETAQFVFSHTDWSVYSVLAMLMPTASMPRCGVAGAMNEAVTARVGQYVPAPEGSLARVLRAGAARCARCGARSALRRGGSRAKEHHAQRQRVGLEALVVTDEEVQVAQRGGVAVGKRRSAGWLRHERRHRLRRSACGPCAARGGADRRCGEAASIPGASPCGGLCPRMRRRSIFSAAPACSAARMLLRCATVSPCCTVDSLYGSMPS